MEYITSSDFHFKDTAVALGKFEGIHRGHQLLMDEVKKQELHGLRSVVFTFDRPTRLTLTGDTEYKQIYTKKERRGEFPDAHANETMTAGNRCVGRPS